MRVSKASPDQGSMWFARMNDVECSVVTIVPVGGAYYNGKWFAGGAKISLKVAYVRRQNRYLLL